MYPAHLSVYLSQDWLLHRLLLLKDRLKGNHLLYLYEVKIDYEKALRYRKNYGAYLRKRQWYDLTAEMWIVV